MRTISTTQLTSNKTDDLLLFFGANIIFKNNNKLVNLSIFCTIDCSNNYPFFH